MFLADLQFFRPTKDMREYLVLLSLTQFRHLSQHQLGRRIGVSSAMAHNYVRVLIERGLVCTSGATNRTMKYLVTERGRRRLASLTRVYAREISRLYSLAKQEVQHRLHQLYEAGIKRIVVFGAAETGELINSAVQATPLQIVGWVDNDVAKHQRAFGELTVSSPDDIEHYSPDAVLIASSAKPDPIRRQLHRLQGKGIAVVTL